MDLLIKGATIADFESRKFVEGVNIHIDGGKVVKIDDSLDESSETLDLKGRLVMPAFVNTHVQLGESIFQNLRNYKDLKSYIEFTNRYSEYTKEGPVRFYSVMKTLAESIRSGVAGVYSARAWQEIKNSGIKGCVGYPLSKFERFQDFYTDYEKKFESVYESERSDKIRVGLWLHSLSLIDPKILEFVSEKMESLKDIFLTIHVDETLEEANTAKSQWGESTVRILDSYKLLNERTVLVHCVWIEEDEIKIIGKRRASVAFCPLTNFRLGSGKPKVSRFLEMDVNACLATDGLATNNTVDLLDVARFTKDKYGIESDLLLKMITQNPATCLYGKPNNLVEGSFADLNIFNFDASEVSFKSLISKLQKPIHMVVDGRFVLKNGRITTFDEAKIESGFENSRKKLAEFLA